MGTKKEKTKKRKEKKGLVSSELSFFPESFLQTTVKVRK
jgi:hypothetical protein